MSAIIADKVARLKQRIASGEIALYPLTLPQREMWEASPVPPGSPANHICCLITVRGPLTHADATAALQMVVDRQEALRISILPGKERPLQMVRRSAEAVFGYRELPEGTNEAVEARAKEVFSEPFDLVQGPLYRVEMLKCGPDHHVLAFAVHHSIADGWTLGVFVQDLAASYMQLARKVRAPLPAVAQSYVEWGAAERAAWPVGEVERRLPFWEWYLRGSRLLWNSRGTEGLERVVCELGKELAAGVRELARGKGATLFSVLLSAFYVALHAWRGADDVVVGSPVANRKKTQERETMGYYAGIVPLRGRPAASKTFAAFLEEVHGGVVDAFANAIPFVELARAFPGQPEMHPIFDTRFALQNHPIPDVEVLGMSTSLRMRSTGTARFDLGCEVTEMDETLEVVWLINPALFSRADVETLDGIYRGILNVACKTPKLLIAELVHGICATH